VLNEELIKVVTILGYMMMGIAIALVAVMLVVLLYKVVLKGKSKYD
jgi:hypothetical protein